MTTNSITFKLRNLILVSRLMLHEYKQEKNNKLYTQIYNYPLQTNLDKIIIIY